MDIITNNVPRQLVCWFDLPTTAQDDFDYVASRKADNDGIAEAYMERFVQYKGEWYDVYDSMHIDYQQCAQFLGWHGVTSDSFFSGVLFRFPKDSDDTVVVGRYMC